MCNFTGKESFLKELGGVYPVDIAIVTAVRLNKHMPRPYQHTYTAVEDNYKLNVRYDTCS